MEIVITVVIIGVVLIGMVVTLLRYSSRADELPRAKQDARAAQLALRDVRQILGSENDVTLDIVGMSMRDRALEVIQKHEADQLERNKS
jgi:type II secretory pathway pseudopilin PulG